VCPYNGHAHTKKYAPEAYEGAARCGTGALASLYFLFFSLSLPTFNISISCLSKLPVCWKVGKIIFLKSPFCVLKKALFYEELKLTGGKNLSC